MIPLSLKSDFEGLAEDVVIRARQHVDDPAQEAGIEDSPDGVWLSSQTWRARMTGAVAADLEGDVLLAQPRRGIVQRLIRKTSPHNTLLITERCDQLCVMCSQPPKKTHDDQFAHYKTACLLAPEGAVIGLSGGEPTLYKAQLFDLLTFALAMRPDLSFHVLTNAQHFTEDDIAFLSSELARKVLWGVPIYAVDPTLHDILVGKSGAFAALEKGLAILCRAGAPMELRTVVMRSNAKQLPKLAQYISRQLPFARPWAIMQLENTGYARNRWRELFFDHSLEFSSIAEAVDIARVNGIDAVLYNFPLCTVPAPYRRIAPQTISDWKRRYEPTCKDCIARRWCTGFFEWHPSDASYSRLGLT